MLRWEGIVDEEASKVVLQRFDSSVAQRIWRAADHTAKCGSSAETNLELRIVKHFADAEEKIYGFLGLHKEKVAEVQYLNVDEDAKTLVPGR
jgi:hypothetical protein